MNKPQEPDLLVDEAIHGILSVQWDTEMANAIAERWSLAASIKSLFHEFGETQDELMNEGYERKQPAPDKTWEKEVAQVFRALSTVLEEGRKSLLDIMHAEKSLGIPKPSEIVVEECIRDIIRTTVESYAENFYKKIQGLVPWAFHQIAQIPDDFDEMLGGENNEEFAQAEHYHAIFDQSGNDVSDDDHVINALIKEITEMRDDQTGQTMPELLEEKLFSAKSA